jgi:hypothetical protein
MAGVEGICVLSARFGSRGRAVRCERACLIHVFGYGDILTQAAMVWFDGRTDGRTGGYENRWDGIGDWDGLADGEREERDERMLHVLHAWDEHKYLPAAIVLVIVMLLAAAFARCA